MYSIEVENVLYQHPAVLECAAYGVPDPTWGGSVRAAVVLKAGSLARANKEPWDTSDGPVNASDGRLRAQAGPVANSSGGTGATMSSLSSSASGVATRVAALQAFCRVHLAAYKVPRAIDVLPELPRTGSGKIAKRVLRDAAATRSMA